MADPLPDAGPYGGPCKAILRPARCPRNRQESCLARGPAEASVARERPRRFGTGGRGRRHAIATLDHIRRIAAAALLTVATLAPAGAEDFWAIGRPPSDQARRLAPPSMFPAATPADDLPTPRLRAPPGFKVETFASDVLDARMLREGPRGTVFVSSLFVANRVYALVKTPAGGRAVHVVLDDTPLPNGIEVFGGALYVATPRAILRFDAIEDHVDAPGEPKVVYDAFPAEAPNSWKALKVGPDRKLYVTVGSPCNVCRPDDLHGRILRMNLDGTGVETVARGIRFSVGFDFDPRTGDLWFTDNQRDGLTNPEPSDELNHVTKPGQDFGFPYCHSGLLPDPAFGAGRSCAEFTAPEALMGPHAAPLGMRFYTGTAFPEKYRNAIFVARHGPWNRARKQADVVAVLRDGMGRVTGVESFLSGFVQNDEYVGRPVDVLPLSDGSLLVSDDHNGAVYRVSYVGE